MKIKSIRRDEYYEFRQFEHTGNYFLTKNTDIDYFKHFDSYIELLQFLSGKVNKVELSYLETEFIKKILLNCTNFIEFIDNKENFIDDGGIVYRGQERRVEFKRMHDWERDKNIFKKKKFFHAKNTNIIWIEYSEKFNWIRIYDLDKVKGTWDSDTYETFEDVEHDFELELTDNLLNFLDKGDN